MPPADDPEAELNDLAAALGRLQPAVLAHRDRILFAAGEASARASARRAARAWSAVAAGLAAVALGEGAWLARRPAPAVVERVVVREPALAPTRPISAADGVDPRPESDRLDPTPRPTRDRLTERLARAGGEESVGPNHKPAPALPTLSGRDLLRRELRSALLEGDRS